MQMELALTKEKSPIELELVAAGRSLRLREMYWNKTHHQVVVHKHITGCEEDTLTGNAKDFATLLEASDPFIQPGELIVGSQLAIPIDRDSIRLGFYDRHYPPGHATILRMGLSGIRDNARSRLATETVPAKRDFLHAVAISYDAACKYVGKYAQWASDMTAVEPDPGRKRDLERIAAVCHELATAKPSSFHAALQLVQFTRVFGGRGSIGRFDQWVYPFYEQDMEEGKVARQEAQELLECLFVKLNEFSKSSLNDDLRNITLAGQTPDGEDACNELTYLCLEASSKLMLPEPKLNVRFFTGSPPKLLQKCCRLLAKGANVLAIYNDEIAVPALSGLGIPLEDARDYCNDGCSELLIGGKSTLRFAVHDSLTALTEMVLRAERRPYATFDEVMDSFKSQLVPFMVDTRSWDQVHIPYRYRRFKPQLAPSVRDTRGDDRAVTFPYFAASIEDCLEMASPTGARYSIGGSILAEVGNTADGLAAIKKLIYEDEVLTWDDLVLAMKADYEGHEPLRQRLLNRAPKYGNDDDYVDSIAKEIVETFCDGVCARACNPAGHGSKRAAGLMNFTITGRHFPASPDGRRLGDPVANSFSPAVGMDKSGPTAVLKSAAKVDLTKAPNGSVLDIALHSSVIRGQEGFEKLVALIDSFLRMPSVATLQVNVIDRDTLLQARENPDSPEFRTLIVRVWGFSAPFVELPESLQDHVLARTEHKL